VPFTKTFNPGEILTAPDVNNFLLNQGYQYRDTIYYTSSGTFVKADYPWLKAIRVTAVGGGAGGSGSGTDARTADSGGGGGTGQSFILASALAASEDVERGAGGAGGVAGDNAGAAGVNSSFAVGKAYQVVGNGGGNGFAAGAGGDGGAGIGDTVIRGGGGQARKVGNNNGGSTQGGSSSRAGQTKELFTNVNRTGEPGQLFGAGGGGGHRVSTTSVAGGAGANGIVIVDLFG